MPARRTDWAYRDPERTHFWGAAAWTKRSRAQRRGEPLCSECLEQGVVRAAEVADHLEHVRSAEDPWAALRLGATQSLCRDHHRIKTDVETGRQTRRRAFAKQAYDVNGWPITEEEWRESHGKSRPRRSSDDVIV
jgi:hypothetical protein